MLILFRDRIRKHSRAQVVVHELILCLSVSNGWTEWLFLVTSSVYRQGSQGPKKRRDLFKIN